MVPGGALPSPHTTGSVADGVVSFGESASPKRRCTGAPTVRPGTGGKLRGRGRVCESVSWAVGRFETGRAARTMGGSEWIVARWTAGEPLERAWRRRPAHQTALVVGVSQPRVSGGARPMGAPLPRPPWTASHRTAQQRRRCEKNHLRREPVPQATRRRPRAQPGVCCRHAAQPALVRPAVAPAVCCRVCAPAGPRRRRPQATAHGAPGSCTSKRAREAAGSQAVSDALDASLSLRLD